VRFGALEDQDHVLNDTGYWWRCRPDRGYSHPGFGSDRSSAGAPEETARTGVEFRSINADKPIESTEMCIDRSARLSS
jgi:hypothetical protein